MELSHFGVATSPKLSERFYNANDVISRTETGIMLDSFNEYIDYSKNRRNLKEIIFNNYKNNRISSLEDYFAIKEDTNPKNLDEYHKIVAEKLGIPPLREERKKRKRIIRRNKPRLGIFHRNRDQARTKQGDSFISHNSSNYSAIGKSQISRNHSNSRDSRVSKMNSSVKLERSISGILSIANKDSPDTTKVPTMIRPDLSQSPILNQKAKPKLTVNQKLKQIEERMPALISVEQAKNDVHDIPTHLTNRSLREERIFLKTKLRQSEKRTQVTKLGGYVTNVDHSDIIIEAKFLEIGRSFLSATGKDVDSLKSTALTKHSRSAVKSNRSESLDLETNNSKWVRSFFFKNILEGNRSANKDNERKFFLDFETLRRHEYVKIPRFEDELGIFIKKMEKENIENFTDEEKLLKLEELKEALVPLSSKVATLRKTFINSLSPKAQHLASPTHLRATSLPPASPGPGGASRYPASISNIPRRPSLMIAPSSLHTPLYRTAQLSKITAYLSSLASSNLSYYELKSAQTSSFSSQIQMLLKDRDYKRSLQSRTFVKLLIEQRKGGFSKVRKMTENKRRKYYSNPGYLEMVGHYRSMLEEVKEGVLRGVVRGNGARLIGDIMDYLRIILEEGCGLTMHDAHAIRAFVDAQGGQHSLGGAERKLLTELDDFIVKINGMEMERLREIVEGSINE